VWALRGARARARPALLSCVCAAFLHGCAAGARQGGDVEKGGGNGPDLPPGEGRLLVERACTGCHDLAGLAAYRGYWNRERWAAMVATMIEHGAALGETETAVVIEYLTMHFGTGESRPNGGLTQ
jgi:hypothetical protein